MITMVAIQMKTKLGFKYIWFMHEFWTISTTNMMSTRLQNYSKMVCGKHGIQTFEVVVVVLLLLLFDGFVPQVHILYYFGQVLCSNICRGQLKKVINFVYCFLAKVSCIHNMRSYNIVA